MRAIGEMPKRKGHWTNDRHLRTYDILHSSDFNECLTHQSVIQLPGLSLHVDKKYADIEDPKRDNVERRILLIV